jgi:cell division protein FtsQ
MVWRLLVKILLGLIVIPGAVILSFLELEKNGFFNLDRIDVVVEETPEVPQYLKAWIKDLDKKLKRFNGNSLWKLNLQEVSNLISSEKWIESVTLTRRFPSEVKVNLRLKKVNSLLVAKSGKLFPVVQDGSVLEAIDPRSAPNVPLLVGDLLEKNEELRKKSMTALMEIPEQGAFSRSTISEIRFDPKEGFWMTLVKTGIKVKMGEDHINLKSDRVSQVIDYMSAKDLDARVIDANLSKKVLVRLRKGP